MLTTKESNEKIITLHQKIAPVLYKRSLVLYEKGALEEAISCLERAIKYDDSNCIILFQYGHLLEEIGKYNASTEVFERLLKLDDSYDECYYFIARNYMYLGLFEQAEESIEVYLERHGDGELKEEVQELLEIIHMEEEEGFSLEDDIMLRQEEAVQCIRISAFEEAILLLENLLVDYPECWSAYNHLAIAFFKKGDYELAMAVLEELLKKDAGNLYGICNKMLFYYSLEKEEEVAQLIKELTNVYPFYAEQQVKLGISFAAVGEAELGYKWLYFLYRNGYMGDISFYYWLAHTAHTKGNMHVAKASWKLVLDFDEDFEGHAPWG